MIKNTLFKLFLLLKLDSSWFGPIFFKCRFSEGNKPLVAKDMVSNCPAAQINIIFLTQEV